MFCMSCKGGAACRNEHTRAAWQIEASDNEQVQYFLSIRRPLSDYTGCGCTEQWLTEVMLLSE